MPNFVNPIGEPRNFSLCILRRISARRRTRDEQKQSHQQKPATPHNSFAFEFHISCKAPWSFHLKQQNESSQRTYECRSAVQAAAGHRVRIHLTRLVRSKLFGINATMRITGVPLHESDLVRQSCTHGFTITEAWSPPRKIPAHAHAMLSITVLLQGDFEERYQSNFRPNTCVKGSLLIRPAGEIHENSLATKAAAHFPSELDPAHFEKYGDSIAALRSLTLLREAAFLDIGIAMSCELRHTDQAAALALESLGSSFSRA